MKSQREQTQQICLKALASNNSNTTQQKKNHCAKINRAVVFYMFIASIGVIASNGGIKTYGCFIPSKNFFTVMERHQTCHGKWLPIFTHERNCRKQQSMRTNLTKEKCVLHIFMDIQKFPIVEHQIQLVPWCKQCSQSFYNRKSLF